MRFVEYARFEDWFKYMGDTRFVIPGKEIVEYYIDAGKEDNAKRIVEYTDDIEEKQSLKDTLEKLFREKLLEDALEKNPSFIGTWFETYKEWQTISNRCVKC